MKKALMYGIALIICLSILSQQISCDDNHSTQLNPKACSDTCLIGCILVMSNGTKCFEDCQCDYHNMIFKPSKDNTSEIYQYINATKYVENQQAKNALNETIALVNQIIVKEEKGYDKSIIGVTAAILLTLICYISWKAISDKQRTIIRMKMFGIQKTMKRLICRKNQPENASNDYFSII